jgi:hypothetical protein
MYQYIKRGDYKEFIKETENNKKYFMEYSGNNKRILFWGFI